MNTIETVLLLIAYSALLITIFVASICYKRNIEKWETIAFAVSLLLLIVSMTTAHLFGRNTVEGSTNIYILLSMILVGLTTPLNVMSERKHTISATWKKVLYIVSAFLFVSTGIATYANEIEYLQYIIAVFLGISVVASMILIKNTEPQAEVAHLEKTNRLFATAFIIIIPISLVANYVVTNMDHNLKMGFTLPLIFTLLAVNKLLDDLKRLSLINHKVEPVQQHFDNYLLSKRERQVAALLAQGKTYKEISEELFISLPTVKTHSSNIYKKCKVNNRHELTILITT